MRVQTIQATQTVCPQTLINTECCTRIHETSPPFTCSANRGVAEHPNGVERQGHEGDHLVPKQPQDAAREDGQGDAGHRAHGQGHSHEELGRPLGGNAIENFLS